MVPLLIWSLCSVYCNGVFTGEVASVWIMPIGMLLVGVLRGVPVYESFIEGAKEGFNLDVMIISLPDCHFIGDWDVPCQWWLRNDGGLD